MLSVHESAIRLTVLVYMCASSWPHAQLDLSCCMLVILGIRRRLLALTAKMHLHNMVRLAQRLAPWCRYQSHMSSAQHRTSHHGQNVIAGVGYRSKSKSLFALVYVAAQTAGPSTDMMIVVGLSDIPCAHATTLSLPSKPLAL